MIANKYKAPKKLWSKFSDQAKAVFNEVYANMSNQELCQHPDQWRLADKFWQTIQHNAACYAAFATDKLEVTVA